MGRASLMALVLCSSWPADRVRADEPVSPPPTSAPAVSAAADEDEVAEARRIFAVGLEHADRSEWRDAVVCFRQVLEIRESAPVLYNLGAALVALGEYPEAEPLLQRVVADTTADPAMVARAQASLTQIEERGGRLAIRVLDLRESSLVYLDGNILPRESLGVEIPLSAGHHELSVHEGTHEILVRNVRVSQGDRAEVVVSLDLAHLSLDESDAEHAAAAEARAERTRIGTTLNAAERRRQRLRNPWLWIGVSAAALGIGGTVFALTYDPPVDPAVRGNFDDPLVRF